MHLRIEAKFYKEDSVLRTQQLDKELLDALNTNKALAANIDTGDRVTMYDGTDLLLVTVVEAKRTQVTVIDQQGFLHICERWSYCDSCDTVIVKALTPMTHKRAMGYDPHAKLPKVYRHKYFS